MEGRSSKRKWIFRSAAATVGLALIGFVGIPYVYVHFINKPAARLSFEQLDADAAKSANAVGTSSELSASDSSSAVDSGAAADEVNGTWVVSQGSEVGYRVKEVISGQATEGVGRTSTVEGSLTVTDGNLISSDFSVDVATMTSDNSRRDSQFAGRIMNTEEFPIGSFTSTSTLGVSLPPEGETVSTSVNGVLTLHGEERPVSVPVQLRRVGETVQLKGSIAVAFADYGIDNPSIGPVKTGDTGEIEFLLTMKRS